MSDRKGLVPDFPEPEYHADPALSQSSAKVLLDCPARYKWQLDHPRKDTAAFDVGHAAHAKVLGVGANGSVSTTAAKAFIAEARAAGQVPLKSDVAASVDAMAEAVLTHPMARLILEREGDAEQSAWWTDHADDGTPVACRARFDKVTTTVAGLPALVDLKTTGKSAAASPFARSVVDFGYDLQDDWYSTGFELITGQRPSFVFIVVEKEAPHLVGVHTLDVTFKERGARLRRDALNLYAACVAADSWPAHGDDINVLTPPRWAS